MKNKNENERSRDSKRYQSLKKKFLRGRVEITAKLPNRIKLNTCSSRRTALELFDYFGAFFVKARFGSIRSNRTSNSIRT